MNVLVLDTDSFHPTVADSGCLVVEFLAGTGATSVLDKVRGAPADTVFGTVDASAHPALAAMFGLAAEPALLIFRDTVVLYLQKGVHRAEHIQELLAQVCALDMSAVRAEIEERKRAETALGMRRVCPAARRGPGPGG